MSKFLKILEESFIPSEYDSMAKSENMAKMKVFFDDIKHDIKDEMIELGEKYEIDLMIDDHKQEDSYYEVDSFQIYVRFAKDKNLRGMDGFEYMEFYDYLDEREDGCQYKMTWSMKEDCCEDLIPSLSINRIRTKDSFYCSRFVDSDQSKRASQIIEKWKSNSVDFEKKLKEEKVLFLTKQKEEIEKQLKEMEQC